MEVIIWKNELDEKIIQYRRTLSLGRIENVYEAEVEGGTVHYSKDGYQLHPHEKYINTKRLLSKEYLSLKQWCEAIGFHVEFPFIIQKSEEGLGISMMK